ncbi:DNA-directed RNA polymerase III complex subunit Rpc25 [Diplodia intermedia]|uniref:DNA-directed RNA polymerase III complex subunit Rpc25 n=1 Tax=Diplodia intermedia TaxID=856260 RepID=A0ABR3U4D9_9PEZI
MTAVADIRIVALEFFDDIFVPGPVNLFEGVKYVGAERVWVWVTEQGDELFFDLEETVRFRVEAEIWTDQSPQAPTTDDTPTERKSPYRIIASMAQAGLGPTLWWEEGEAEE